MSAKTLTVVFTDIKGFTERTSKSSRAQMVKVLKKHEELLRPIILRHGGRVVKTIGDAFLLTFESPTNAVLCGLRMQACLSAYNATAAPEDRIDIRVSMNTGEVELIGDDIFGETVNLASRVEGITDAGEVYFTESTYLVMNKSEVPTSQVGAFRFEGIPEKITIYRVIQDENLELYNRVVQSKAVAEPVQPQAANVPEGAFSTGLLYSREQRDALERRSRRAPWISALIIVCAVGFAALAYRGYHSYRLASTRDAAATLIANDEFKAALNLVGALHAEYPADSAVLELLEQAVDREAAALRAANRYDEVLRRLDEHRARYPDLPRLDEIRRETRIHQASYVAERSAAEGRDLFEALHADYPQDNAIALHLARHTAVHFDLRRGMYLIREAHERQPIDWTAHAWIEPEVQRYVERHYRDDDTLRWIDHNFYAQLRPRLLEHIVDPDAKDARRNAYALLSRHGDLTAVDEFRFFTAELFYRTIIERWFREETFAYFENLLAEGVPQVIQDALPVPLPPARVLNNGSPDRERARPIIEALFPEALPE